MDKQSCIFISPVQHSLVWSFALSLSNRWATVSIRLLLKFNNHLSVVNFMRSGKRKQHRWSLLMKNSYVQYSEVSREALRWLIAAHWEFTYWMLHAPLSLTDFDFCYDWRENRRLNHYNPNMNLILMTWSIYSPYLTREIMTRCKFVIEKLISLTAFPQFKCKGETPRHYRVLMYAVIRLRSNCYPCQLMDEIANSSPHFVDTVENSRPPDLDILYAARILKI